MKNDFIKSPLNYTGGKYKLLKDIFSIVPDDVETFYDIFGGGFNVGINAKAKKIVFNDQNTYLAEMFEYFKNNEFDTVKNEINNLIKKYDLNKENRDGYNKLRDDYNEQQSPLKLFVLTCYSFNHQIRFNNSKQFNTPFGKDRSNYNSSIEENLRRFCEALHNKDIELYSKDFTIFYDQKYNDKDLVYCDPPYLITTGSYNDGNRGFKDWGETEEKKLLEYLDHLNSLGIRFVLSNVLYHKNMENKMLVEWSKKYNVIYVDKKYYNCNYHLKSKDTKTIEVLITNIEAQNE